MTRLKIKANGSHVSLQVAISYNPCDGCHRIVGNAEIVSRFCGTCCYSETRREVVDSSVCVVTKAEPGGDRQDGRPLLVLEA